MNPTEDPSEAASGEVSLAEQLDAIILAYTAALDGDDWAEVSRLDHSMKDLVERALAKRPDGAVPTLLQQRLQVLTKLNQRALSQAKAEREKVAGQLQDLSNAKAGAKAYADNAKL